MCFSILLIWIYTFRGGIKTVVWTDTIQTFLMILAVGLSIFLINEEIGWSMSDFIKSEELKAIQIFLFLTTFLKEITL